MKIRAAISFKRTETSALVRAIGHRLSDPDLPKAEYDLLMDAGLKIQRARKVAGWGKLLIFRDSK